jgi:hypothetical protein
MSHKNRTRLNKIADHLQALADGFVACLEVVLSDHGGKRPRRSSRTITRMPRQTRTRVVRQVVYRYVDMRTGEVK